MINAQSPDIVTPYESAYCCKSSFLSSASLNATLISRAILFIHPFVTFCVHFSACPCTASSIFSCSGGVAWWRQGVADGASRGPTRTRVPPRVTPRPRRRHSGTPTYSEQNFVDIKERGTPHDRPAQPYLAIPCVLTLSRRCVTMCLRCITICLLQ